MKITKLRLAIAIACILPAAGIATARASSLSAPLDPCPTCEDSCDGLSVRSCTTITCGSDPALICNNGKPKSQDPDG